MVADFAHAKLQFQLHITGVTQVWAGQGCSSS